MKKYFKVLRIKDSKMVMTIMSEEDIVNGIESCEIYEYDLPVLSDKMIDSFNRKGRKINVRNKTNTVFNCLLRNFSSFNSSKIKNEHKLVNISVLNKYGDKDLLLVNNSLTKKEDAKLTIDIIRKVSNNISSFYDWQEAIDIYNGYIFNTCDCNLDEITIGTLVSAYIFFMTDNSCDKCISLEDLSKNMHRIEYDIKQIVFSKLKNELDLNVGNLESSLSDLSKVIWNNSSIWNDFE